MKTQADILAVFENEEQILSKSEIIEKGKLYYYHNTKKHVGDMLSRMVNNGKLERVKRGHFKINTKFRPKTIKEEIENPNQIKIEL